MLGLDSMAFLLGQLVNYLFATPTFYSMIGKGAGSKHRGPYPIYARWEEEAVARGWQLKHKSQDGPKAAGGEP